MNPLSAAVNLASHIGGALRGAASAVAEAATPLIVKGAAKVIVWHDKADREFLEKLTGSKEILTIAQRLAPHVPDLTAEGDKEKILIYLMANTARAVAAREVSAGQTVPTRELFIRLASHFEHKLFNSFESAERVAASKQRYVSEEDFTAVSTELLNECLPFVKGFGSGIVRKHLFQLYKFVKASPDLSSLVLTTKQRLRDLLADPDATRENEDAKIASLVNFSSLLSNKIVSFTEGYLNKPDRLAELLEKHIPQDETRLVFQPLLNAFLKSDIHLVRIGREKIKTYIGHMLLKGMANMIEGVQKESAAPIPNSLLLVAIINKLVRIIRDQAPSGELAAKPEGWIPLTRALMAFVFPDLEKDLPLPAPFNQKVSDLIVDKILPGLFCEWFASANRYLVNADSNRSKLEAVFGGSNHASEFCRVVGGIYVGDFIPHILNKTKDKLAPLITDMLQKKLGFSASGVIASDIDPWISDSLSVLASQYKVSSADEPQSPMKTLSEWGGVYAEAFMLQVLGELFGRLHAIDKGLQEDPLNQSLGKKSLLLAFVNQIIPEVSTFYERIKAIKDVEGVSRVSRLSREKLVAGLEGTLEGIGSAERPAANLLSKGFPTHLHLTEAARNDHRLAYFKTLSERILAFSEVTPATAPLPAPVRELGMELLSEIILASAFPDAGRTGVKKPRQDTLKSL